MTAFGRVGLMALLVAATSGGASAQTGRLVELTGNDLMKYSVTAIAAKPGELLHIRLKNVGTLPKVAMAHNFVLLAKGTDAAAFANASATAYANWLHRPCDEGQGAGVHADRWSWRNRRGDVQGARRAWRIHVPLQLPRPLPERHEGRADSEVGR